MIQLRNSTRRYGAVARLLHWSSVALMLALYIGISGLDVPPKLAVRETVVASHATIGLVLLVVIAALC